MKPTFENLIVGLAAALAAHVPKLTGTLAPKNAWLSSDIFCPDHIGSIALRFLVHSSHPIKDHSRSDAWVTDSVTELVSLVDSALPEVRETSGGVPERVGYGVCHERREVFLPRLNDILGRHFELCDPWGIGALGYCCVRLREDTRPFIGTELGKLVLQEHRAALTHACEGLIAEKGATPPLLVLAYTDPFSDKAAA